MIHRMRSTLCGLLLSCAVTHAASAALFKVGDDAACTHRNLAEAIAAAEHNGPGMDEIRLVLNHHAGSGKFFIIDQSLRIVGGYQFCSSAAPTSGLRTQLSGAPHGHFVIASQPDRRSFVELVNLELYEGNGSIVGGSMEIYGRADVTLNNSVMFHNWGERGGAIYIDGLQFADPASLTLIASEVHDNLASYDGGGIDCHGGAQVLLKHGSSVRDNKAVHGHGGGVALDACRWWQGGGTRVSANTASAGGGIFAASGSTLLTTWATDRGSPTAPKVSGNKGAYGDGIALTGAGTYLDARGLELTGNSTYDDAGFASVEGVALYAGDGAAAWLHRDELCKPGTAACSRIQGNYASIAAGSASIVFAETSAWIVLAQTEVSGNVASAGNGDATALLSSYDAKKQSRITLRNSVVSGNQASTLFHSNYPDERAFSVVLSTLKDNHVGALFDSYYVYQPMGIDMMASVIDEMTPLSFIPMASDSTFDCMLTRAAPGLASTRSMVAAPLLSANGQPLSGSPAIDFCSSGTLPLFEADFLGRSRPLNDWEVPDRYGPVDVGAFEVVPPSIVLGR